MIMKKYVAILSTVIMSLCLPVAVYAGQAAPQQNPTELIGVIESVDDKVPSSFVQNVENAQIDRPQDEGQIYVGYAIKDGVLDEENSNWTGDVQDITLENAVDGEGFTAIRAEGSTSVTVTGQLALMDDSDGQAASDFSGVGAAITGTNGCSIVVDDFDYYSEGFGRSFAIISNTALSVLNSRIVTMGRNPLTGAYDGYYNSANTSLMISPPWVLGIQGGIRAINILGQTTSLFVADSAITAGSWAAISTDGCQNPYIWIYNTDLNILPESEGGMNSGW